MKRLAGSVFLAAVLGTGPAPAVTETQTSCIACHSDPDEFDETERAIVSGWESGVHAAVRISCHDCHGGDPEPDLADDMDAAMDPDDPAHPFLGAPSRKEIPDFCGRCHSSAEYMKRFRPDARIDQVTEYWTSYHGAALARGDVRVATCVSCHGVHGILRGDDQRSPVYPTRVADTCGGCHADPKRMASTLMADGSPLPVDQLARWRESAHGHAMMDKGDLYAPTCNDCHGNHGATPPGVGSITFICGQCHAREADLLRKSPKHAGFERHNEFLAEEPTGSCAECHDEPDPASSLTGIHELGQCTACHGNHSIGRPTTALLGVLPETPCALCHGTGEGGGAANLELPSKLTNFRRQRETLLARAAELELAGEKRYDWLVDRLLELPFHTYAATDEGAERRILRPEFERLFRKFRVGKTTYAFADPATGETRVERARRCSDCHAVEPGLADAPVGMRVAHEMMSRMQEVETRIARAERTLLSARRGGVEVGEAEALLDQALASQISLQVLVHSFSVNEDSPFVQASSEGLEHADAALAASRAAVEELAVRRRGLYVFLVFVVFVLVGLFFRIREVSRRGEAPRPLPSE